MTTKPFWETTPLHKMDRAQWEALCDGCGKCCLHKLEDDVTGEVHATNVACRLLDSLTALCTDYRHRRAHVPECMRLTPQSLATIGWLPSTCAYRLLAEGQTLPPWHYLVSGDRETVHSAGISTRGWTVSEVDAGDLEYHLTDRRL